MKRLGVVALLDLVAALLLGVFLPRATALEFYLGSSFPGVVNSLRTERTILQLDSLTGWRNRPDLSTGKWVTDYRGARQPSVGAPISAQAAHVLFVGSSTVNGGAGVSNDETISAYVQGACVTVSNFGTMLYSADQSLIFLRRGLPREKPTVIVVGLDNDVGSLGNLFVPLKSRAEVNVPLLKPAFRMRGDSLEVVRLPIEDEWRRDRWPAMLDSLKELDSFYDRFESYRWLGITPVASLLRRSYLFADAHFLSGRRQEEARELQTRLIRSFVKLGAEHEASVIFLKFAERDDMNPPWYRDILGNEDQLNDAALRRIGVPVVFVKDVLAASKRPLRSLYSRDGVHLTPEGNRLVASALRSAISTSSPAVATADQDGRCHAGR